MNIKLLLYSIIAISIATFTFTACQSEDDPVAPGPHTGGSPGAVETDFVEHLTNQVNEVIIPAMLTYQAEMADLVVAADNFTRSTDEAMLERLRSAYETAYLAYQAAAVHNYFATANQALVTTSNLFPVDTNLLIDLIAGETYNFNTTAQKRANGFPALDFLLYGPEDVLSSFQSDAQRAAFLVALVNSMKDRSDVLADQWTGSLRTNFIENGGTQLGSSISVQLNESLLYFEDHIRENKVGIPIGRLGPNDSPIPPDPTKIEAYFQSLASGNEEFSLALLQAAIEAMEDTYLGTTSNGEDAQGYDDLLLARGQASIDEDIRSQFAAIYNEISGRSSISGDASLYEGIQELVTLYKSDLFPVLNVQDADGANDGD